MPDVVPLGHDEDGDGVPDSIDVCPHLDDPAQDDADLDFVGDGCDPNPAIAGDVIALFATMMPGDQPFSFGLGDGVWTQLADSLELTGDLSLGGDNNLYEELTLPMVLGSVRVAVGVDITAVLLGSDSGQNQLTLTIEAPAPLYFGELNQQPGLYDNSQLTLYDGANFIPIDPQDLPSGIPTGPVTMETTHVVDTSVSFVTRFPTMAHVSQVADNLYQGGTGINMRTNNLHFEIRWVVVITSP